MSRACRLRA
ncbi:hypothetical protein EYF80_059864 [Liparis tanakae]|uniref:Uncharacterized protein n=1 Tax=Liparis tanakae TaxID=230148 RepID=A0A4Z2EMJ2_9TELE|nr:hypothetical protein EYF80_059864 [Liparis tanakae]